MLCEQMKVLLQEWLCELQDMLHRLWMRLPGWDGAEAPIQRKRRRRKTHFHFGPRENSQNTQLLRMLCGVFLVGVFVFSMVKLVSYGLDYVEARKNAADLRALYYQGNEQEEEPLPTATPEPITEHTAAPTAAPTAEPASAEILAQQPDTVPDALPTPPARLKEVNYPGNPYRIVSSDFQRLRRQNADIVGWLKIEDLIDEVVVQRDNSYYLHRDYRGYHNVNGAIFLDENCDLRTRPYTYLLYGHNMKSGLMFGNLRNYENLSFYKKNPFITFDTAYEDGRYVIFAAATVSTDPSNWRYLNVSWLLSSSVNYRSKAINQLKRFSVLSSSIEVLPEDQILLLVTCVGEQEDRRVVAARRVRDNESEQALMQAVKVTTK